ncbi:MAG: hypothetical protein EA413_03640 [Cyanobium sp. PLM2.Bin73]|nr:MAG: hypothetical protein EA413_03640 [Cyanobium sp. PLM2.Bin73]
MANLTLAVDDALLKRAREVALRENTSVNAVVREFLTRYVDAHQLAIKETISWFDALIVEAAIRSRCEVLFSEDLSHGRKIGHLELINPLLESP